MADILPARGAEHTEQAMLMSQQPKLAQHVLCHGMPPLLLQLRSMFPPVYLGGCIPGSETRAAHRGNLFSR